MQNLLSDLTVLLKKDERFVAEGKLLKNPVIEAALQLDPALLKLLLSHKSLKKHFFRDIEDVLVFDKIEFQKFVSNKSFLKDSYTAFSNKIGLTSDDEFISESKDVVLSWPHKDCVLEGGQTKEDEKRDEIFWNETLAPDEIDRLLSPKVFTNFKKYDSKGEHKVTDISLQDNLIIKGNNLLALHSLLPVYNGQVKLIYIDPPYNTGNDEFGYNDSFNKSTWLTFMMNRLRIARSLLREDGAIFIQINDKSLSILNQVVDEIFKGNFINLLSIRTKSPSGFKTVNLGVFESAEFILIYGKNKKLWKYTPQYVPTEYDSNYKYEVINLDDDFTKWKFRNIDEIIANEEGFSNVRDSKAKLGNNVFLQKMADYSLANCKKVFRYTEINQDAGKETLEIKELSLTHPNKVYCVKRDGKDDRFITDGNEISFYAKKVRFVDGIECPTNLLTNIWSDIPWEGIAKEGGVKLKKGKKPEKLLRRIIEMSTTKDDLVMDFYSGSGTTCAVAHKLGRKYIGIEQLDYGDNDSVQRLKNVINGDTSGISKITNWKGGGSFVYCELNELNKKYVNQIKTAKITKELKQIWESMKKEGFISYKVNPEEIDKDISEFEELSIADQKKFLIEVLDKNHLYANYSEINDKDYSITEDDKKLNKKFYSLK